MTARLLPAALLLAAAAVSIGCNHEAAEQHVDAKPAELKALKPQPRDTRPAIVVLGDSLSAGFGLEAGQSYPDHLQKILDEKGYVYQVVNQGLSGDTSTGGLARIDEALAVKPEIVLVEFGGNDGLRGIPTSNTRANLSAIIERIQASSVQVLLAGITLPRNYGDDYIKDFDRIFPELAAKYHVTLIPFLLEGLISPAGAVPGMIQQDGIHPTAKGTPIIARTVFSKLEPMLTARSKTAVH